jgi:uncharacterized protein (TIGR00299 family) protein
MKILYCDCYSGISGDMFLAGLLDAGLPLEELSDQLAKLNLAEPFSLRIEKVRRGPIAASLLHVDFDEKSEGSEWRHLEHIQSLIKDSGLKDSVKVKSVEIFTRLAEAEAHVHGTTVDEVHFHEVGAIDSLIDIVGACAGLDSLKIERVFASALPIGTGQVETRHGPLPVPAPATLELMRVAHMPVVASPARMELVTPTGAAILACLASFQQPSMSIEAVGIGAGQKEMPWPNILRVIIGESNDDQTVAMVQIETNIDDMNPQVFGHVMNRLFSAGALDVYFTPIFMKKNRPATMLSIIAHKHDEAGLAQIILEETTTFGVRVQPIYRYEADRSVINVITVYGEIPVKLKILGGKTVQAAPEYDDCIRLAGEYQVPLMVVYQAALTASQDQIIR